MSSYCYSYKLIALFLILPNLGVASDLPLFDAHVHYSSDVWNTVPPHDAISRLKQNGVQQAIVSSTPAKGAVMLYEANPVFVIPFLRPYRSLEDRRDWYKNPQILEYVKTNLEKHKFRGLGEFHLFGSQVDTPVMKGILKLATEKQLIILTHSNHETIDALFNAAPSLTIIWAHGGFDVDTQVISDKLKRYNKLYIELSFREGVMEDRLLSKEWQNLFMVYSSRFLVGTDTYIPQRWLELPEITEQYQTWLNQLPANVAQAIAYENGINLFRQ